MIVVFLFFSLIHSGARDFDTKYGCQKGAGFNGTKCLECSDLNEDVCKTFFGMPCQWKGGKCKSGSCPNWASSVDKEHIITYLDENELKIYDNSSGLILNDYCHFQGCLYAEKKGRCGVWSIWAFVLTIISCSLFVLGGAIAFFVLTCYITCWVECWKECCVTKQSRPIEVICFSIFPRPCFCAVVFAVFLLLGPILGYFTYLVYTFASGNRTIEGDPSLQLSQILVLSDIINPNKTEDRHGEIEFTNKKNRYTLVETGNKKDLHRLSMDKKGQGRPILFYFLSDYPAEDVLFVIFMVPLAVVDVALTLASIFYKIRYVENESVKLLESFGDRMRAFILMGVLGFSVLVFDVLELVAVFVDIEGGLLLIWPVTNFLRIVDVLVVIFFRTKKFTCFPYKKKYSDVFLVFDFFGSSAGLFARSDDHPWEVIASLGIEAFDTLFAIVFSINSFWKVSLPDVFLNVLSFFKVSILSFNVAFSVKGYIRVYNYAVSIIVGSVIGILLLIPLMVLLILTIIGKSAVAVVYCMIPLFLAIICVFVVVLGWGGTGIPAKYSAFGGAEGNASSTSDI